MCQTENGTRNGIVFGEEQREFSETDGDIVIQVREWTQTFAIENGEYYKSENKAERSGEKSLVIENQERSEGIASPIKPLIL